MQFKMLIAVLITILVIFSIFLTTRSRKQTVTIYRDGFGIPHVVGESEEAVMYGFGYAQAEDHLEDMIVNYLTATGRLSEFFGEKYVSTDYKTKALKIPDHVYKYRSEQISDEVYKLIEAFAEGVNSYIEEHKDELPKWIQNYRVKPEDVIAWGYYMALARSLGIAEEELKGVKTLFEESNEWAIGKSRTADGSVILLADPHLPWTGMNRWYEAHLVGGKLNVYGATFYGIPFIVIGHNDRIAWTLTRNGPDLADVFIEKLNPENHRQYLTENGWEFVKEETIEIKVKTATGYKVVKKKAYYTRHGLVVEYKPEKNTVYSIALESWGNIAMLEEMYRINIARNLAEFKKALEIQGIPLWNILYADVEGNLYYVYNARIHRKSEKYDHKKPRPGWEADAQWGEIIPFSELPQIENPEADFIQNNNVMPWFTTINPGMNPEDYPSYLVNRNAEMNDRGRRAFEVLANATNFTLEDAMALATDTLILKALELKTVIIEEYGKALKEGRSLSREVEEAIEILKKWNCRADKEEAGMTIFHIWYYFYLGSKDSLEALQKTVDYMLEKYGRVDVKWGEVHVLERGGRLYPLDGGTKLLPALWMATGPLREDGVMVCDSGSSFTMLVVLKEDMVTAYTLLPYGESENPDSPHYDDQAPLKSQAKLKKALFDLEEIKRICEAEILEYRG